MKELTIEEKAKAYDNAFRIAKELYDNPNSSNIGKGYVCTIFPELKESNNERIRKALIKWISKTRLNTTFLDTSITREEATAWLEKQVGQKPTDNVEPFDKFEGLTDFERTLADICIGWVGEEYGWKQYIKDNADVLLKIAIKKFNSVQDALFEQNPTWSEEDAAMLDSAIAFVEHSAFTTIGKGKGVVVAWLKSLKHQSTWKPSDAQMKALKEACDEHWEPDGLDPLYMLWEQLKKLKE